MLCSSTPIYTHSKEQSGPAASMALLASKHDAWGGKGNSNMERKYVPAFARFSIMIMWCIIIVVLVPLANVKRATKQLINRQ